MTMHVIRSVSAVIAASAVILSLGALPASATNPGAGAVIFNPDSTPIGSQLTYGAGSTRKYVYTTETTDDDFWGLDTGGEPANNSADFNSLDVGIPLGFTVDVAGVDYDRALVSSNGGLCLVSSTDTTAQESFNACANFYGRTMGIATDPDFNGGPDNYAAFLPFNMDLYPPDASTPVDTNADTVPDECTFGAYLFQFGPDFYCSAVFWGTTTYEGKPAFAATWYHDPDFNAGGEDDRFNTFQVLVVDDGSGNATLVYNYDDINHDGQELDYDSTSSNLAEAACGAAYDAGDTDPYYFGGVIGTNFTAGTPVASALFGPACDSPVFLQSAANLQNGGSFELISHNLNSTVPGRYVFRMVGGLPTYALAAPPVTPAATLPNTGADVSGVLYGGLAVLAAGVLLLLGFRRRPERA